MNRRITIGVSACLAGMKVRFDGDDRHDAFLSDTWGPHIDYVSFCPETEAGLGIPREPMGLVGTGEGSKVVGRETGRDYTAMLTLWASEAATKMAALDPHGIILKDKSPSCAWARNGEGARVAGVFARELAKRMPRTPVIDSADLKDRDTRLDFVRVMFLSARWRRTLAEGISPASLAKFHTENRLALMARNPTLYAAMGRVAAKPGRWSATEREKAYGSKLAACLAAPAPVQRIADVFLQVARQFPEDGATEKAGRFSEGIEYFRRGRIELAGLLAIFNTHSCAQGNYLLKSQTLMNPDSVELALSC